MSSQQDNRDHVDGPGHMPDLVRTLRAALRALSLDLAVCRPAQIVAYDATTQTADVTLGYLPVAYGPENTEVPQPPIVLTGIPVRWRVGLAGTAYVTVPLALGDTGHVHFADRALETWLLLGPAAVDPINGRAHDLSDAFFEPGLRPSAMAIKPPTDPAATVVEGPLVKCGRNAVDFAAKGTTLKTHLDTFLTALSAVTGGDPAANAAAITAISAAATAFLAQTSTILSAKVSIE